MEKKIRLAGIAYESLVNGPGLRRVFFSQGCRHKCKGCFNLDTHSFFGGKEMDMNELISEVLENPILEGVTFSGGDPFERAKEFAYMAEKFKENKINIWAYTGYTIEWLLNESNGQNSFKELLKNIDVLVDGRFEESLKKDGLKFKGSENQRIIDVPKTLELKRVVLWRES